MRVVVLGAGFGGLELTTQLSDEFGDDVEVVLIDKSDGSVFGFSKLDVMFGESPPSAVHHPNRDLVKPGVRFVQSTIRSIDPVGKRVVTDAGEFDADVLVVALGADLHPTATPGLVEGGNEFYTVAGAFALRDVLAEFDGGRVIVAGPLGAARRQQGRVRLQPDPAVVRSNLEQRNGTRRLTAPRRGTTAAFGSDRITATTHRG